RTELEAADSLRQLLAKLDDFDRHSPPLYMRFGLYSGNELNERLREVYFDSVNQRFFKNAAGSVERELQSLANAVPQTANAVPQTVNAVPQPGGGAQSGSVPGSAAGPAGSGATPGDDLGRYYDLLKA